MPSSTTTAHRPFGTPVARSSMSTSEIKARIEAMYAAQEPAPEAARVGGEPTPR